MFAFSLHSILPGTITTPPKTTLAGNLGSWFSVCNHILNTTRLKQSHIKEAIVYTSLYEDIIHFAFVSFLLSFLYVQCRTSCFLRVKLILFPSLCQLDEVLRLKIYRSHWDKLYSPQTLSNYTTPVFILLMDYKFDIITSARKP